MFGVASRSSSSAWHHHLPHVPQLRATSHNDAIMVVRYSVAMTTAAPPGAWRPKRTKRSGDGPGPLITAKPPSNSADWTTKSGRAQPRPAVGLSPAMGPLYSLIVMSRQARPPASKHSASYIGHCLFHRERRFGSIMSSLSSDIFRN